MITGWFKQTSVVLFLLLTGGALLTPIPGADGGGQVRRGQNMVRRVAEFNPILAGRYHIDIPEEESNAGHSSGRNVRVYKKGLPGSSGILIVPVQTGLNFYPGRETKFQVSSPHLPSCRYLLFQVFRT